MKELTRGNPAKLIILFALPLFIGNVFQQFYSMVDMIVVGQTLGKDALAAVGATSSVSFCTRFNFWSLYYYSSAFRC